MQHPEEAWIFNGKGEVPATARRVKIAENITRIPDEAFQDHQELEEVVLSSSVQVIGRWAFCGCEKLKSILYQGIEKEEVGIPSNVKAVEIGAFSECTLLARLVLNEGLEQIGEYAFFHCKSITEVSIPSTVKVIEIGAFGGCTSLATLVLNEGLERIGQATFESCESLTEVSIPSTVKVIDSGVFWGCEHLARLGLKEGLERIGKGAFKECQSLTEVEIPSTVKEIDYQAFEDCYSLEELVLNEGLERIGEFSFCDCQSLTGVDIPSTVKVIGNSAFSQCIQLARLGLNEGLERIGDEAFMDCFSLSHVRIPQSVNSIADIAFVYCRRLISIELPEECSFDIELPNCQSLVSLAGPISIFLEDEDREQFFQSSKLGRLVDNEADLIRRLNHRFDNSPLNQLCYYQSYHSYEDEMAQLHRLMEDDPLAATTQVDEFGMTPLHILSLSQTLNMDMLLAVMQAGRLDHIIFCKDSFGSTAMDYLCFNRMPTSTEVIRRVLEARFARLLGLDRSLKSKMLQATNKALKVDWPSRRREVVAIYLKLAKYERKEIFSLVELRLWKTKIDKVTTQEETVDREFCRVNSGASIVLPHVQPFLDELDVKAYCASYPDQLQFRLDV